jgi:hypothetical protein
MGLPKKEMAQQVSYWRPYDAKDHSWSATVVEYQKSFKTEELAEVQPWLTASAYVMRAFQWQQSTFNLPFNGYLMYVCNDSTVMSVAKYQSLSGKQSSGRLASVFPVIRAQSVTDTTLTNLHVSDLLMGQAGVDKVFADRTYPTDYQLEDDQQLFEQRIKNAFGQSIKQRLTAFPELLETLQKEVW